MVLGIHRRKAVPVSRLSIMPLIVALAMPAVSRPLWASGPVAVAEPAAGGAAAPPARRELVLAPADARHHVGEEGTVEFVVAAGRLLDDRKICFLNSERDYRDPESFTAVIFKAGLARFAADGVPDPAETFAGARVRVRGTITERDGRAQIVVEAPPQIEIVRPDTPVR